MDLFVNVHHKEKENTNPVLVPTQFELLQKEGIFTKNFISQNRYYHRKNNRPSITQNTLQTSSSSKSLQREIDRIVKALQQQKHSQQILQQHQQQQQKQQPLQVEQMVDMLQNDNLLRIHQLKPHSPRKPFTPIVNGYLPPLETQSNDQNDNASSQNNKLPFRYRTYSRKTTESKVESHVSQYQPQIKKASDDQQRHKRTTSQLIINAVENNPTINQRIRATVQDSKKILKACAQVAELDQILDSNQLQELINCESFKIELQHLINRSSGTKGEMQKQLKSFIIDQAKKYKELQQIEAAHSKIKGTFSQTLKQYIIEIKQKL